MTWSYATAQLATSKLMQVRFLIGDTQPSDPLVQDEEVAFALSQRTSPYGAAAILCRAISARLSREADTVDKDLRTTLSARATAYARRAADYEAQANIFGGATPYAGGVSISDKVINERNTDRVQPQFTIDMDDNYLPVAPVGNEPTPQPVDQGDPGE